MYKVNISIDDVCTHPKSSIMFLYKCKELISIFPNIKFTLFIPMMYTRLKEQSYDIRNNLHFVNILKGLDRNNFELGWHGLYHGIKGKSNNDEFRNETYKGALDIFKKCSDIAKDAGIFDIMKPIFRPSAFRMSPESIEACKDMGIKVLCLSNKPHIKKVYAGKDEEFKSVLYYTCNPPFDDLQLTDKTEIVYHACEWDKNYFSDTMVKSLTQFLLEHKQQIKFSFIQEMV